MYFKVKKIIKFFIFLPFAYLIFFELFLRVLIFLITLNSEILEYGFNKNINLSLHSIRKGEFYIVNNNDIYNTITNKKSTNKNQLWVFGGSTSNQGFCDSKNLSWVDLMETNLNKRNFSKNGINSSFSLNLLKNEFKKKEVPEIIIWANKVNEVLHIKRAENIKNNFFYFTKSLKLSLKQNILLFYFFDEFTLRLFDKMKINIRNEKISLSENDYILASKKFFDNTKLAIELANFYEVKKFYIISLFNRANMDNLDTKFYKYYIKKVNELIETYDFVKFLDTKSFLNTKEKELELFCDSMHHNYDGKVIVGKIVSNFINDK
tara:strand:+ start:3405 stop:4367 length:963 start_codon:yes stop_codon:yes gene_type:complete